MHLSAGCFSSAICLIGGLFPSEQPARVKAQPCARRIIGWLRSDDSRLQYLYELFDDLKIRFNGNMFDQDLDTERRLIQAHPPQQTDSFSRWP